MTTSIHTHSMHTYIFIHTRIIEAWNPIVGMVEWTRDPRSCDDFVRFQESHSTTVGDPLRSSLFPRTNRSNSKATSRDDVPRPYHDHNCFLTGAQSRNKTNSTIWANEEQASERGGGGEGGRKIRWRKTPPPAQGTGVR